MKNDRNNTQDHALEILKKEVAARMAGAAEPRFALLMSTLVSRLHDTLAELDVTEAEWEAALKFLTKTGQASTDHRQEFVLLSDALGLSTCVVLLGEKRARGMAARRDDRYLATENTVEGPFYIPHAPEFSRGADIAADVSGEPTFYSGHITDTNGHPVQGASIEVWSGNAEGLYDVQTDPMVLSARATIQADANGAYSFWSIKPVFYPVPMDGPVGAMLSRIGQHPNRPAHIHMKVCAPGHAPVTTQLFVSDSAYMGSDAVFGVRESLILHFEEGAPGRTPDGREVQGRWWRAAFDFRLAGG